MASRLGSESQIHTISDGLRVPRTARLTLINGFSLTCDEENVLFPISAQRLLAFLALHDRPMRRTYVAGALWLDSTEERAHASLRTALWRVHKPSYKIVDSTRTSLRLASHVWVDVREMVGQAVRLMDLAKACEPNDLDQAPLSFDLLPDWYDDWALVERERIRQLRVHALEALCQRLIAAGRFAQAVQAGRAAVAAEPFRESAQKLLIQAHVAEGNRGEAVRQHARYRQLLEELGLTPSLKMERLVPTAATPGTRRG